MMKSLGPSLAALIIAGSLAAAPVGPLATAFAGYTCDGSHPNDEFRWPIKSLSDDDRHEVDFHAVHIRIMRMRRLERPDVRVRPNTPRIAPEEMTTYQVRARPVRAKLEPDGDVILVVAPPAHPRRTIVFEFGNPRCVTNQFRREQIGAARRAVLASCGRLDTDFTPLRGQVRVRGVGFWDRAHSEPYAAPNAFQLWPVLHLQGTCTQI
jgi:hypothetical protein